ncbi:hypothetical protein RFF05_14000 [Bengtsoniella intestinalis]|uniref:hypothetical protein n=1 Tax=Bengtsoniella intestinalis TaxID=3073143 RepID=UPI00391F654E
MLIDRVLSAQKGDSIEMLTLVEQFAGLFRKYGRKLGYEDAENDLQADFIELVMCHNFSTLHNTTDGSIVNYIARFNYRRKLQYQIEHFR